MGLFPGHPRTWRSFLYPAGAVWELPPAQMHSVPRRSPSHPRSPSHNLRCRSAFGPLVCRQAFRSSQVWPPADWPPQCIGARGPSECGRPQRWSDDIAPSAHPPRRPELVGLWRGLARSLLQECQQRGRGSPPDVDSVPIRAGAPTEGHTSAISRPFDFRYGASREPPDFLKWLESSESCSAERFPVPARMCFAQLRALAPVCGEAPCRGMAEFRHRGATALLADPVRHRLPRSSAMRLSPSASRSVHTQRGSSSRPHREAIVSSLRIRDAARQSSGIHPDRALRSVLRTE